MAGAAGRPWPCRARNCGQFGGATDRQHGRADHLAFCPTPRIVAVLRSNGHHRRPDRRVPDLFARAKRREASHREKTAQAKSSEGFRKIQSFGISYGCAELNAAPAVSTGTGSAGGRGIAVSAKEICRGLGSWAWRALHSDRRIRVALWKGDRRFFFPLLQTGGIDSGGACRFGGYFDLG